MMRFTIPVLVASLLLALSPGSLPPAAAQQAESREPARIADFLGRYEGQSISVSGENLSARDLSVEIATTDGRGFSVAWTTVVHDGAGGEASRKSYTIEFRPTSRAGIFSSAMRVDAFGARRPLDPMTGVPYVWARLADRTLTVYALHILDDGSYEMQVYDRTLTAEGMHLNFTRLHNGEALREITGELRRIAG